MILNAIYSLFFITHLMRLLLNLKNETSRIEIAVEAAVGIGAQHMVVQRHAAALAKFHFHSIIVHKVYRSADGCSPSPWQNYQILRSLSSKTAGLPACEGSMGIAPGR